MGARTRKIHNTPCVICHKYGMEQLSRTTEHHWIHGRFMQRKTANNETLPICDGHHQGSFDDSKIALHQEPKKWQEEYGRDKDWLDYANDLIEEYN